LPRADERRPAAARRGRARGGAGERRGGLAVSVSQRDGGVGQLLVLIDVGNTNTVLGVYRGDALAERFRLSTDADRTADAHRALLLPLFARAGIEPSAAAAVVVSSVVPPLNAVFDRLGRRFFGKAPLFVEPGIKTGMPIRYDNPTEVGADRI